MMINRSTTRKVEEEDRLTGLTSIHRRIHCAATQDADDNDELDRIAIENFLQTLSDVALSIAKRREPIE